MAKNTTKRKWKMTRRGFLMGLGATGGTLALGFMLGKAPLRLFVADTLDGPGGPPGSFDTDPTAWFEVTADNKVKFFVSKVEMGQGIHTSMAQIAADELGITWEQLEVLQGSTAQGPADSAGTGASNSISATYTPLRQAAATLREMLRTGASVMMGVAVSDVQLADGEFSAGDKRMTFGDVVASGVDLVVPPDDVPLFTDAQRRYVGQPMARVDLPAKITGKAVYGYDMRVPDMLYGAVLRPSTIEGKIVSVGEGVARSRRGVVEVVIDGDFAGIIAETRQQAWGALSALEVEWDDGKLWEQAELEELTTVQDGEGIVIQKEGDIPDEFAIVGEYRTPFAIHAHLEPQAALAHVTPEKVTIWGSTQGAEFVRGEIAEVLGRDASEIEVTPSYLGGGFGRKLNIEAATEAARLSAAVGRPVHVGWTRREDMRNGYFRPPTHHKMGAVVENGTIRALQHHQASGDVAFAFMPRFVQAVMGADFGAWRGGRLFYNVANRRTISQRVNLPIPTGWWRGLGLLANVFAVESFVDELAENAGMDPLQFRLDHLGDDDTGVRMKRALETVAEMAKWGDPLPAGHALGVAGCIDAGTVTAQIAEVSLDESSGEIQVHNVWAVVEPGKVINPDGAIAQTQGSIIMGLSSTLIEEVTVANGRIQPGNFDRYPLLTMARAPHIEVQMLERPNAAPTGMGEPPIGPIAAAVGNAFFALTGVRLRQMPFTTERVMAAMG